MVIDAFFFLDQGFSVPMPAATGERLLRRELDFGDKAPLDEREENSYDGADWDYDFGAEIWENCWRPHGRDSGGGRISDEKNEQNEIW